MPRNKTIAVIGGGYTGLVAAYKLAQRGHAVTIYERGTTLGGLAGGFTIEGAPLERAYHHLFRTDTDIIRLSEELGIADKLQWHTSSVAIYWDGHLYSFVTPLDLLRFKPLRIHNRIRAGLVVLYLQKSNNWQKLRHITALAWMRKWAGKEVTNVIWEPLLRGKFDRHYDKVSMAWLWARVHIRANSKEKGESSERLGYFDGGFETFTNALVKKLESLGVQIVTGAAIDSLGSPSGRPTVQLQGQKHHFDKIIATIPSDVFAGLVAKSKKIPATYIASLKSINYLGAALFIFSSRQNLSKYYWHNVNDTSLPFLVFINHTQLIDKSHYGNKYVYYVGAYLPHDHPMFQMPEKNIERLWLDGLRKIFPDLDEKQITERHFFKFKNAQHIVDTEYQSRIPAYKTPLPNVYLANFSQIYPEDRGTNYAVREGIRIAKVASS